MFVAGVLLSVQHLKVVSVAVCDVLVEFVVHFAVDAVAILVMAVMIPSYDAEVGYSALSAAENADVPAVDDDSVRSGFGEVAYRVFIMCL